MARVDDNSFSGSIFICYRRQDSADSVDRIYDELAPVCREGAVYRDLDAIPVGTDFPRHIAKALASCDVVLVFIGPAWLDIRDYAGTRRLEDPADHVRIEIETALNAPDMLVVPVFVREARMPRAEELPVPLRALVRRNGVSVRPNPHFPSDVVRLVTALRDAFEESRAARKERALRAQQSAAGLAEQVSEVRLPVLQEGDWTQLLEALEAGRVIPVLGPTLGTIEFAGHRDSVSAHLAARMATRLKLETLPDNARQPLQSVALRFAEAGGSSHRFMEALRQVLDEVALAPTEAVRELALMKPIRLFLTDNESG